MYLFIHFGAKNYCDVQLQVVMCVLCNSSYYPCCSHRLEALRLRQFVYVHDTAFLTAVNAAFLLVSCIGTALRFYYKSECIILCCPLLCCALHTLLLMVIPILMQLNNACVCLTYIHVFSEIHLVKTLLI